MKELGRFIDFRNDRVYNDAEKSDGSRPMAENVDGDVYVWDIDKTYLDTRFSSLRGLAAIPFELAVDKRAIGGTATLLRALRVGPDAKAPRLSPLYFISGSPKGLRSVIEKKMLLDGVQHDGITFKDQVGLLKALRPGAIKEQIGYKLAALLMLRKELPRQVRFTLFGDDVESDMDAFLLFGEVCAGLRGQALRERLRMLHVAPFEVEQAVVLADAIAVEADPVERVCINSVKGKLLTRKGLDARVVVTRAFLQTALVLHQAGKVDAACPAQVRDELRRRGLTDGELDALVDDAHQRLAVVRVG